MLDLGNLLTLIFLQGLTKNGLVHHSFVVACPAPDILLCKVIRCNGNTKQSLSGRTGALAPVWLSVLEAGQILKHGLRPLMVGLAGLVGPPAATVRHGV